MLIEDYVDRCLEDRGTPNPTPQETLAEVARLWPDLACTILVQEPWQGTVRFKRLLRLRGEVRDRTAARARCQEQIDALRRRLNDNQALAALLPSQIESRLRRGNNSQAWCDALELDRIREAIVEDQAALPRLEQTAWSLDFLIRLLQRRLTRLRTKLERG